MFEIENIFTISELYISDLLGIMYDYSHHNTKEAFIDYMNAIRDQYETATKSNPKEDVLPFSTTRKSFLEWMNGARKPSTRNLNVPMCHYIFDDMRYVKSSEYSALMSLLQILKNRHIKIDNYESTQQEISSNSLSEKSSQEYCDLLDLIVEELINAAFNNGNSTPHEPNASKASVSPNDIVDISFMRQTIISKLFPGERITSMSQTPLERNIIVRHTIIESIHKTNYNPCKITLITGSPCTGKSTFLKDFVSRFPDSIFASFFCQWDTYRKNSASRIIKNIAYQLQKNNDTFCIELYKQLETTSVDAICSMDTDELFDNIILLPLEKTSLTSRKYIIIDALDELDDAIKFMKLLEKSLCHLPNMLKIIISSRNTLNLCFNPKYYDAIEINRKNSSTDIGSYLSLRLSNDYASETIEELTQKCGDNFLYAKLICDDFSNGISDISKLPSGLEYIYQSYFQRAFSKFEFTNEYRKAFSVIIAAKENISLDLLSDILKWDRSIAYDFSKLISDLINNNSFPQQIEFFHKSIDDWLKSDQVITEFQIDEQQGLDLLFEYIVNTYKHNIALPYSIIKDWEYYGKRNSNRILFEQLFENVDFILEVIKQERQHCNFESAFSIINSNLLLIGSKNYLWYMMQLALNDIYIDLSDERMVSSINTLLNNLTLIPDNSFYTLIHLYENAGWIYMQTKDYSKSNYYFSRAIDTYKSIPVSVEKKIKYAHTLYLHSVSLYRQREFEESKKYLLISQNLISQITNPEESFDYSLGLKILGWVEKKLGNLNAAAENFSKALNIQKALLDNKNTFLAHTYYCLSEIEYQLYEQSHDVILGKKILDYIIQSKKIYSLYDASYQGILCKLNELERKIVLNEN